MKQWDIDCATSETFQTEQASMDRRDKGNADALAWAQIRARLALQAGQIPCPACGGGFMLGCERCWDEGILNGDGTPLHEHNNWDDYWQWWEAQQKEGDYDYNIRQR